MIKNRKWLYGISALLLLFCAIFLLYRDQKAQTTNAPQLLPGFLELSVRSRSGKSIKFSIPKEAAEWAQKKFGDNPTQLNAVLQLMEANEYIIRFPDSTETHKQMNIRAVDCMMSTFGPGYLTKISAEMMSKLISTKERLAAFERSQQNMSGSLDLLPPPADKEKACEFSEVLSRSSFPL